MQKRLRQSEIGEMARLIGNPLIDNLEVSVKQLAIGKHVSVLSMLYCVVGFALGIGEPNSNQCRDATAR